MKKILTVLISIIFILSACKKTEVNIIGYITCDKGTAVLDKNVPMQNAKITIHRNKTFEVYSDKVGFFAFKDIQAGTWKITVEKDGYITKEKTISVVINPGGEVYHENFKLEIKKP